MPPNPAPRWPPVAATASIVSCRSSWASWRSWRRSRRRRSAGVLTLSSRGVLAGWDTRDSTGYPYPAPSTLASAASEGKPGTKASIPTWYLARRNRAGTPVLCGKFYFLVDRSSTARGAVKLARTAYTCLLLPTRSSGYGGHGARECAFAHPTVL